MAPLPPESTARYFVDYATCGEEHTMEIRATAVVSPATFGTILNNYLLNIQALIFPLTVNIVRFAATGSTISNPVTTGMEGQVRGAGTPTVDNVPIALNFVGRSGGGRRVRLMTFGYKGAVSAYRLTSAEDANISDAVDTLNTTANCFLAIDNTKPVWYAYANVLSNAYWQRRVRAG